ncbi:hypothetical protein [Halarsenatibacter silvermanii]|uniref:Uncharacterized protein n=1 Tax=Halarsenatibacter silvermanii TaxID=321763 RepID=A0A1G9RXL9_9FIRM|nr:hypothetical protein [Halarsenatibacter silvermanii]SDM27235.1 hypothetical protein SAMN04488692_12422 [Halarsenatibacter silvermanii]
MKNLLIDLKLLNPIQYDSAEFVIDCDLECKKVYIALNHPENLEEARVSRLRRKIKFLLQDLEMKNIKVGENKDKIFFNFD